MHFRRKTTLKRTFFALFHPGHCSLTSCFGTVFFSFVLGWGKGVDIGSRQLTIQPLRGHIASMMMVQGKLDLAML